VAASAPAVPSATPQRVVVTATRVETPAFDVPASIDRIDGEALTRDRAATGIAEGLAGVPGLLARDRQNFAQDVQLSLRGFGARSSFGIRGVRLYVDGLPATFPDGQGRISQVELGSVDHVEVLRGPFSALYGNSAGGVVQVFSDAGGRPPAGEASVVGGSFGLLRESVQVGGGVASGTSTRSSDDPVDWSVGATHFHVDGEREHAAADRTLANAKVTLRPVADDTWTLVLNDIHAPLSQDPLGLTREAFDTDPEAADPTALQFDTRKTLDQLQGGVIWDHRFGEPFSLHALAYAGYRRTVQFQAIPVGAQLAPSSPGGVIDLGTHYRGAEAAGTWRGTLAGGAATVVGGVAIDDMDQRRLGYQNFIGAPSDPDALGVQGALRRDEDDLATAVDEYVQATWQVVPRLSVAAGLRHSRVDFDSHDHYIVPGNGDDSGRTTYDATLPVLGVTLRANEHVNVYATAGRGFETPTYNELAYRPDGTPGLNFALRPARSDNYEVGLKARDGAGAEGTIAYFRTLTRDEIVTLTNTGGRSTYQNAGATRRDGIEAEASAPAGPAWRLHGAATVLDARYTRGFVTCNLSPCPVSRQQDVPAGNKLPGVPWLTLDASADWMPSDAWRAGVDARVMSGVFVDDVNSDEAPAFTVVGLHVDRTWRVGGWRWTPFARVDNLFDRRYAGSVIVNEGNGRFFEPAPRRGFVVGLTAAVGG
jgi:iron complex outermembrane receptor protein